MQLEKRFVNLAYLDMDENTVTNSNSSEVNMSNIGHI